MLHEAQRAEARRLAQLNELVKRTGAAVVVSSFWRCGCTLIEMRELLRRWGFAGKVLDLTPVLFEHDRGDEIQLWLDTYREKRGEVESFVILDDDDDMGQLADRLVQTEFMHGLKPEHVERAEALLKTEGSQVAR